MARSKIIAGNWKMHKTRSEAQELASAILQGISAGHNLPVIVLCPPFTSLEVVLASVKGSAIEVGAQNMDWRDSGAFTGEISAPMLTDLGVKYVILGHSERRQYFAETNLAVNKKLCAALKAKLVPILCVGETADEREANLTDSVVSRQVAACLAAVPAEELPGVVLAYEPVWAIGTGNVCSAEEANRVARLIRSTIGNLYNNKALGEKVSVLYGGSVNPDNINEQLAQSDIDGGLIGGASLKSADFLALVKAAQTVVKLSPSSA